MRKRSIRKAEDIAEAAKQFAPVKTGALRDSIEVEANERTGEAKVIVGVDYGVIVEYGGVFQPAQPYMNPAIELVKREYRNKKLKI